MCSLFDNQSVQQACDEIMEDDEKSTELFEFVQNFLIDESTEGKKNFELLRLHKFIILVLCIILFIWLLTETKQTELIFEVNENMNNQNNVSTSIEETQVNCTTKKWRYKRINLLIFFFPSSIQLKILISWEIMEKK